MDLAERYIHAVTRHLPASQRADVAAELRATIADMTAEHTKDKKPGAKAIEAALRELGRPEALALQYSQTKQYLIGPQWFDTYVRLLKQLLLYIPGLVAAIVFAVAFFEGEHLMAAIVDGCSAGVGTAIHIAFWTTLGFAIAERSGAHPQDMNTTQKAWSPHDLPALPRQRHISVADAVTGVVLMLVTTLFVLIGFGVIPWSGSSVEVLNPAIWNPWGIGVLVLLALTATQEAYKLVAGRWAYGLAATNVILNTAAALFLTFLLTTQDVINPIFLNEMSNDAGAVELRETIQRVLGISVIVTIIVSIWSSIDGVRKALRQVV